MKSNAFSMLRSSARIRWWSRVAKPLMVGLAVLSTAASGFHREIPGARTARSHPQPFGNIMRESHEVGDPDILAAEAVLLFLHSSLPDSVHVLEDRILLLPSGQIMTADEAARALAALEKPVECYPEARDGVLVIECLRISEKRERFQRELAADNLRDLLGRNWRKMASQSGSSVILSGRDRALLLSVPALVAFHRDYRLDSARLKAHPATAAERQMGLVLKVEVERLPERRHFAIDPDQ